MTIDGTILVDTWRGIFVPRHKRRIGYVFQEGATVAPRYAGRQSVAAPRARPRCHAGQVATGRPERAQCSTGVVAGISAQDGPIVEIRLDCSDEALIGRLTRYSVERLGLTLGAQVHALIKSVALDRRSLSGTIRPPPAPMLRPMARDRVANIQSSPPSRRQGWLGSEAFRALRSAADAVAAAPSMAR